MSLEYLYDMKRNLMQLCSKTHLKDGCNLIALLNIPERLYNYAEYQDGLVSDDFK